MLQVLMAMLCKAAKTALKRLHDYPTEKIWASVKIAEGYFSKKYSQSIRCG